MIHMGDLEIRSIFQRLPDNLRELAKRHMCYTILHSINTGKEDTSVMWHSYRSGSCYAQSGSALL